MARRHAHTEEADINITPMLDIVFIMLIFFIVTTSFTKETGASIIKPEAEQAVALRNGTILIGIRPNDDVWMAKRQIELREVRQMVERAKAENPEGSVVIIADKGSRIGTVTQVMDQVRLAGVEGIAISAGSACSSGAIEPSHVLLAMGQPEAKAAASIRISLGWNTESADIDRCIDLLRQEVRRIRGEARRRVHA